MTLSVRLAETAQDDLFELGIWIAAGADKDTARHYVARIEEACHQLADYPRRGSPRDDIMDGLRSIAFGRRATIFYRIEPTEIVIVHILHSGRAIESAFPE